MKPAIFRQFSIRGHADDDLTAFVVQRIGQAMGTYFRQIAGPRLVVGYDVRLSSPRIEAHLISGLLSIGCYITSVGLVPTPVLNFAVDHFGADGGIMITASHNPAHDNGFKLRATETLIGEALQAIYILAEKRNFPSDSGIFIKKDGLTPYLAALQKHVDLKRPLKIVIDGGNGANGPLMSKFLRQQGHTVIELFNTLNGQFPNRNPDPTAEDALKIASQTVLSEGADCGLAYDGDGDRVALIDNLGQVHFGDIILMLLARQAAQTEPVQVVYDISCTQALVDDVLAHGGEAYPAPVGYAFVHEKMKEIGATLGGETAGHIFCLEDKFQFDDALLASVKLLNLFSAESKSVADLIADLPHYHTSANYRLACPDDLKATCIDQIRTHYQATHPIDTTDGVKVMFERGWALIRQSNTQPALSFRAEGETRADLKAIKETTLATINQMLTNIGVLPS